MTEMTHCDWISYVEELTELTNSIDHQFKGDNLIEYINSIEHQRAELLEALHAILQVNERTPVLVYQKMEDIARAAIAKAREG